MNNLDILYIFRLFENKHRLLLMAMNEVMYFLITNNMTS